MRVRNSVRVWGMSSRRPCRSSQAGQDSIVPNGGTSSVNAELPSAVIYLRMVTVSLFSDLRMACSTAFVRGARYSFAFVLSRSAMWPAAGFVSFMGVWAL